MARLPTVKVRSGGGYVTINESDFDPKVHTLFTTAPVPVLPEDSDASEVATSSASEAPRRRPGRPRKA